MIAVGIISGMSVIAVPSYDKYKVRATQAEDDGTASEAKCTDGPIKGEDTLVDKLAIKISPSVKYFYGNGNGLSGDASKQREIGGPGTSETTDNATRFKIIATAKRIDQLVALMHL